MEHIIGWIITGLATGAVTHLFVHGKQGIVFTALFSAFGALLGGLTATMVCSPSAGVDANGTYALVTACPCWIMAVFGSVFALGLTYAVTEDWHEHEPDVL